MKRADGDQRRALARVAMGEEFADAVVRGGRIVEVHTGAIVEGDVAISGDRIAAVGDVSHTIGPDTVVIPADGAFLVPGFIDAHIHTADSQLPLPELSRLMVARGTTAISVCLIETAWLAGRAGVELMLERTARTPLSVLLSAFGVCHLGDAAPFDACTPDDLQQLLSRPETVEIREWSVVDEFGANEVMRAFVDGARERGLILAGHLEGLTGPSLQASAALGVMSDHEATTAAQALERARLGISVQMREGVVAHDLERVLPAVTELGADPRMFQFCTDDLLLDRLAEEGHIDRLVRMAIAGGVDPIEAIRMASINAAQQLHVEADLGSIAPGRKAHINLVDDLTAMEVRAVVAGPEVVARDGVYLGADTREAYPDSYRGTMHLQRSLVPTDFEIAVPDAATAVARVMVTVPETVLTAERRREFAVVDGNLRPDGDVAVIAAVDRYTASGQIGLGLVEGLGVKAGAFAATCNPGLMQLMVAGADTADMALAANRVAELDGGIAVVRDGQVLAELALPLMGVYSDLPADEAAARMGEVTRAIASLGPADGPDTFSVASFMLCLASLPSLRLTTFGPVMVGRDGSIVPAGLIVADGE